MAVTANDLATIAAKASTLFERLEGCVGPEGTGGESAGAQIEAWCRAAAGGDAARFARRLALDALNVQAVRSAFSTVLSLTSGQALPGWTRTVAEAMDAAATGDAVHAGAQQRYLDPDEPIPFEQILTPFVTAAIRRLEAQSGEARELLSEQAHTALERSLLTRLSELCSPTLGLKFSVFLACRQVGSTNPFIDSHEQPAASEYGAFVREMLDGELWVTLREYPVLARLAATAVDLWVEATAEFLRRLCADKQEIQRTFGVDPGRWTHAEASLSDRHNSGRSVIVLTSASGMKLVYKPKNLGTEAAYGGLVNWLNARGSPLPLKALEVLDRNTHGWAEFAEQRECRDHDEATRFYRRAGMLLCLHYILETTDCHRENLVACGEHPVIVDLETLMHPRERAADSETRSEGAASVANEQIWHSVLRVGLLPRWDVSKGPDTLDLSGLGSFGKQEARYLLWRHVNTDRMERVELLREMKPACNEPMLNGEPLLPHVFRAEIAEGFHSMYRFLWANREALLAADGPLAALSGQQVRFVFRDTKVYHLLHEKLLHPRFLQDGAVRSIELDALARSFLSADDHRFWPIVQAEREAMERLDVPSFAARSDSDSLSLAPGRMVAHCFEEPSHARVISRLRGLSETDLNRQTAFIRGALFSRASGAPHRTQAMKADEPSLDAVIPLDAQALLYRAVEIAEGLRDRAIRSADGGATWIAPTHMLEADRFQIQALGCDLYNGATGVGLFLSALEGVTGGAGFRELALGALAPVRETLHGTQDARKRFARELGIGGVSGMGAIVYALVRAAHFLEEAELLEDARGAAALIMPESISADEALDVFDGAAGAILGLLSLHETGADPWALEAAVLCGSHLLEKRTARKKGPRAWASPETRPLTGYSHGAAGIAYALLRLCQATGDPRFREAAEEAIAYERQVFAPESGNWPDFRMGDEDSSALTFFTTWCHGAPGIGLARLGGLPALDTPEVRGEIDVALKTTLAYGLRPLEDHLCCGHFGRMDLLVTASERLGRAELLQTARKQAAWVVERAQRLGDFQLHDRLPHGVDNPGFFTGSAGIGYQLLRLAHPDRLPSALLWA